MKIPVWFLSVIAGLITSLSWISEAAAAKDGESEMGRIVGGSDAKEGEYPFACALYIDGQFFCTCSVIGEWTILTAAHCVVRRGLTAPAGSIHVIAHLNRSAESVRMDIASVKPHPDYSESDIKNDIAILKTIGLVPLGNGVQRICIARRDTAPRKYAKVIAVGWGDTTRTRGVASNIPEILQFVEQKVVGNFKCQMAYLGRRPEPYQICAGDLFNGICNGDSGGPLIYYGESGEKNAVQVGVASYGSALAGCGFLAPSVWTRPSFFIDFIRNAAGEDKEICEM